MKKMYCFPCEENNDKSDFEYVIELIYDRLGDEVSKKIFKSRLLYSLTRDYRYVREMLMEIGNGVQLNAFLDCKEDTPILVYGAGINGTRLVNLFPDKNWKGYIDSKKQGMHNGLPIYSVEQSMEVENATIIISNLINPELIKKQLVEAGMDSGSLYILNDFDKILGQHQYFEDDCIRNGCDFSAYFVDVGCYNGEDTKRYLEWCGNKLAPVVAFEADSNNFEACREKLQGYSNVTLYGYGLSDKEEVKRFKMTTSPSSKFSDEGDVEVRTQILDDVMGERRVGFIKMDVEGHEEKCLMGAKRIISKQHPVLAISIYHKRSDIWKLPEILLGMNPGYKFYLRHYTVGVTDTVLYAVDEYE